MSLDGLRKNMLLLVVLISAKSSAEDSLSRFSNKPGVDSWPTSDDDILGSETKKEPKPNLAKLMKAFQQSKRNQAECGIVRRESTTLSENNNSDTEIEDVVETLPKPSPGVQGFSHPAFPRPDPLPKPLKTLAGLGLAKVEEEKKHKDAADESRLIQQRKSGGNNKQAFPAMENKGSHSDPGVHRKGVKKKNDNKWTLEERVIAPIFEKTDSLTGGLLHVNDDSILREVDQDDGRPARKTAYEKKKVSDSGRKARGLLRENHMQDAIAMARLGIDTVNNQNQEKEKKCFEGIEIVEGENDYPQEAIKLNKETLTKAIFQHTGQLNIPIAENTMLNPELENAKQSKQRLETEVESYRSRLAPATHDHDQDQTSQRDLELASQKAKDKRLRLQEQMKIDMANLKSDNEMLSQELSKVKNKFNQLKIKLHQTTDDLREKTLMLERVQRDLRQAQCQKQVIEHMFNEQGKVNEYLGKQESLRERLSQLQSENMLLRQQLDDAQNRADSKEKIVISIRDQFLQTLRKLQAEHEEQRLMLEERNTELIMLWKHVEERMRQYENEKAEGEAVVRHLQQELSDSFKKRSELAESLDIMSYHCAKLEVEAQDLKSNLHQLTSQVQETQDICTKVVKCAEKTQDHIQKLEMENTELQTTVKKQADRIKQLQENLLGIRSMQQELAGV